MTTAEGAIVAKVACPSRSSKTLKKIAFDSKFIENVFIESAARSAKQSI